MKIKELFDSPEKWTQGEFRRDSHGHPLALKFDRAACSWCLHGAVTHCYGHDPDKELEVALKILGRIKPFPSMPIWNDEPGRTFAEVRALVEELDV